MPIWNKIIFQNRNSPLIEHLSFFHDHSITILTLITIFTIYFIISSITSKYFNRFFSESQEIELFWTRIPAFILIFIAIPSLKTLYLIEENINPTILIKTIGYQWNWSYEYSNFNNNKNLSTLLSDKIIRLINTSNHLFIPTNTPIQTIITSKDVLHSWTIPSIGIKADATPGRINQLTIISNKPGYIIGQCSEICGAGHSFIPITIESISIKSFTKFISLGDRK